MLIANKLNTFVNFFNSHDLVNRVGPIFRNTGSM